MQDGKTSNDSVSYAVDFLDLNFGPSYPQDSLYNLEAGSVPHHHMVGRYPSCMGCKLTPCTDGSHSNGAKLYHNQKIQKAELLSCTLTLKAPANTNKNSDLTARWPALICH